MSASEEGKGNWIFGLILLVIGIIFIVENFTDIEIWGKVWKLWPTILFIWGIKEIWQNKSIFFGIILISIGAIFFTQYFFDFVVSENIWKFWPILIIALGVDQVVKSFGGAKSKAKRKIKEEEI
ncbi:MAG: hypothetical protein XD79_0489 [Atribacteria bacterium 34_128]|nr:MAG: hypothetical protein XD79_0489 [Atribacteria bacterium 34_128]